MKAKHWVSIMWGSTREPDQKPYVYEFKTPRDMDMFMRGVEEASGWLKHEVVEAVINGKKVE